MPNGRSQLARRGALTTAGYIVGGLFLGMGAGGGVEFVLRPLGPALSRVPAGVVALALIFLMARAWSRRMASLAGLELRANGRWAGLWVAVPIIAIAAILAAIEPAAVQRGAGMGFPLHDVYATLFFVSTLIVVAVAT